MKTPDKTGQSADLIQAAQNMAALSYMLMQLESDPNGIIAYTANQLMCWSALISDKVEMDD